MKSNRFIAGSGDVAPVNRVWFAASRGGWMFLRFVQ
jgi:hypothetical protein